MRCLIAAVGSRGDIAPTVALGKTLRERGHAVTFCAPPNLQGLVAGSDLEFVGLGGDTEASIAENSHGGKTSKAFSGVAAFVLREARAQFRILRPLVEQTDLVLATGITMAGPSLAELARKPYRFVVFAPQHVPSAAHPPVATPWLGLPGWANRLLWAAHRRRCDRMMAGAINHERLQLGLPPCSNVLTHLFSDPLLVASDALLGGVPDDTGLTLQQTGSWYRPSTASLSVEVERFLGEGAPPVYAGFGSMVDPTPRETTAMLIEAARRAGGLRLIISRGWSNLGVDTAAPGVLVIGDEPHDKLFPRVHAVIHHGGAGTTSAAARAGVPQIVVPFELDQHYWASRVAHLGVGPAPLPRRRLSAERLTRALREITSSSGYGNRAAELGRQLQATRGVEVAADLVEQAGA